jgi:hypothetical protein
MRERGSIARCGVLLACLIAGGCQGKDPALSEANYRQKFDRVEAEYRQRPGELRASDVEAILGPGEAIQAGHADLAATPPDVAKGALTWSRWACGNEALVLGFADGRVSSVGRLRR